MFEINDDIEVDDEFLDVQFDDNRKNNCGRVSPKLDNLQTTVKCAVVRNCNRNNKTNQLNKNNETRQFNSDGSFTCVGKHPLSSHRIGLTNKSLGLNHVISESSKTELNNVGNQEIKRKPLSEPKSRPKRERKFPGPAGLLPDRKSSSGTPLKLNCLPEEIDSSPVSCTDDLCSQGQLSRSVLEEEPWQSLLEDLGSNRKILEVVNIASLKRKAASRCFIGRKVPFLAAVLHHLDVSSPDPCIILRDSTGEIHGTLHRQVWEQFAGELVVGSVLVIRNVGLLSTGISARRHYLNITANNLVTIYSANPEKSQKRDLNALTSHDFNQTIEQWRSLVASSYVSGSPTSHALFNSSLTSPSTSTQMHNAIPYFNGPRPINPTYTPRLTPSLSQNKFQNCGNIINSSISQQPTLLRVIATGKTLFPVAKNPSHSIPRHDDTSLNLPKTSSPYFNRGIRVNPPLNENKVTSQLVEKSNSVLLKKSSQSTNSSASGDFKSNPALENSNQVPCVKSGNLSCDIFSQSSLQLFSNSEENCNNENRRESENNLGHSNSKVILSQSSHLTVEEQSVVENVFDGIDADSLFDDDF